jgi:hypothetical protein
MKTFKTILIVIFCLSSIITSYGQIGLNKLAQSTMNFQLVSISPKASAMGEAFYSVGTGSESVFYNPSGLSVKNKQFDVTLNYTKWIADITYLAGAVSYNLEEYGTVALSVVSVNYGTIYATSLDPSLSSSLGYIDLGTLDNVGAYSFGLSYAKSINQKFSIGGNIRYVGENFGSNTFVDGTTEENKFSKLVFDAGVLYNTGFKNFRFGMAIRNFSSNIKRKEIDERLPISFTMGAAIDLLGFIEPNHSKNDELTFAIDFLHSNSYSERTNLGIEYRLLGMLAIRGGYQTNRDIASWSAGLGLNTTLSGYDVEINYSFSKMDIFDSVNRIGLGLHF